jgi:hypothetical protein
MTKNVFARLVAIAVFINLLLSGRALTFNTTFDSTVTSSTNSAQIQSAFNYATSYLQMAVTNAITINLTVSFTTNIGLGSSSTAFVGTTSYASLTNALRNARTTANDSNAVASLPASDPTTTNIWWYPRSVAKALGVLGVSANSATSDGHVNFESTVNYTFDPTNRAVSGKYDFIGVALHEITEVMGRVYFDLTTTFTPYDLFRFSAPGVRVINNSAPTVYFSTDNGTNNLRNFNPVEASGDLTDWTISNPRDCCDYAATSGRKGLLSYSDLAALDVIGFKVNYQTMQMSAVRQGANLILSFTNIPGTTCAILASTNLNLPITSWVNLGTNNDNVTPGKFSFTNAITATNKARFYRARLN